MNKAASDNIRRLATALLCAAVPSTAHAAGAMDDYHIQCHVHSDAAATCASLVARLEALERPARDERLALLNARNTLAGWRGEPAQPRGREFCAGVRALATDHPDYADAIHDLAFCDAGFDGSDDPRVALGTGLRRVLEIDPGNFRALRSFLMLVHGASGWDNNAAITEDIESEDDLAGYREALYEAAKDRAEWASAAYPPNIGSQYVWQDMFVAARYLRSAAARAGDPDATTDLRARVRRDAGLDALGFGRGGACPDRWRDCPRGSRGDSLALACHSILYVDLGLEDVCLAAVENLAGGASADGLPLPSDVLEVVDEATYGLRRAACAQRQGLSPRVSSLDPSECQGGGAEATETVAVRRLRAVLENHGGAWSSEHYRVHAQGFLGDDNRVHGLRTALQADAGNALVRCQLATALHARGDSAGVAALGDVDRECLDRADFAWGDRQR